MPDSPEKDPRVYLAAERTLLAWIRTGIAMMGFGFVVARFGLFLHELHASPGDQLVRPASGSRWFGTALVLMGVIVTLLAALHHERTVRRLQTGAWSPSHTSRWGVVVAIAVAVAGLAVTAQLQVLR